MIEITSLQQLTFLKQQEGFKREGALPSLEYQGKYPKHKVRDFYSDLGGNFYILKLPENNPTPLYPHRNNVEGLLNAFKGHMMTLLESVQKGLTGSELSLFIKRLQHHPEKIKSKLKYQIKDEEDLRKEQERLITQAIEETFEGFVSKNKISKQSIAKIILDVPEMDTDPNNQLLKHVMLAELDKNDEIEME